MSRTSGSYFFSRIRSMKLVFAIMASLIVGKLFYLQVIMHDHYNALAEAQHQGSIILPAKRGDILLEEGEGQYVSLATDISMDLVYVDPGMIPPEQEQLVAESLAPLLFEMPTEEETEKENQHVVIDDNAIFIDGRGNEVIIKLDKEDQTPTDSYEILLTKYEHEILQAIQQKEVNYTRLKKDPSIDLQDAINSMAIRGVFVTPHEIYADPTMINDPAFVAGALAEHLPYTEAELQDKLSRRPIRYIPLKRKVRAETSEKIKEFGFAGVGLYPEHWRFYPENELAAQIVGYVDRNNEGQYGMEVAYNDPEAKYSLKGVDGKLLIDRDPNGNQIAVGKSVITEAQNGDSFVLSINRAVQAEVEKILAETVEEFDAEAGQIIVQDPMTGKVIAMANYPQFNPNSYWEVFDTIDDGIDAGEYKNKVGAEAFRNKAITDVYEPGSVFKVVTLVSALDANEIEPNSINCERDPIVVIDNYRIGNHDGLAYGCITMTQILEKSSNLGALSVAQKLGKTLFYNYMRNFGIGESTEVNIGLENYGWVKKPIHWADVDLASAGFGQGFSVNPLQMANIISTIANGGNVMQPIVISKIIDGDSGEITEFKPTILRRAISADSAEKMKAMMVSSVDRGIAKTAYIEGYHQGGKTGTSQIAKDDGTGYLEGPGSTYASYAGFLPYDEPRFVVLTKIDKPMKGEYGSQIAAPATKKVFEFLIDYYGIKPDY